MDQLIYFECSASNCHRRGFGACFGLVEGVELLFLPRSNYILAIIRGLFFGGQGTGLPVSECSGVPLLHIRVSLGGASLE